MKTEIIGCRHSDILYISPHGILQVKGVNSAVPKWPILQEEMANSARILQFEVIFADN